jgi:hypothetical protein
MLPKMNSSMKCSRLNGRDRQAEPLSGFGARETLQFAKVNYGAQALPQAGNGMSHRGAKFIFG